MADLEVLHTIDKRLAVLEAMSEQRAVISDQRSDIIENQLAELRIDIKKIANDMSSLKIKVASISIVVSFLTAGGVKWLSPFLS